MALIPFIWPIWRRRGKGVESEVREKSLSEGFLRFSLGEWRPLRFSSLFQITMGNPRVFALHSTLWRFKLLWSFTRGSRLVLFPSLYQKSLLFPVKIALYVQKILQSGFQFWWFRKITVVRLFWISQQSAYLSSTQQFSGWSYCCRTQFLTRISSGFSAELNITTKQNKHDGTWKFKRSKEKLWCKLFPIKVIVSFVWISEPQNLVVSCHISLWNLDSLRI